MASGELEVESAAFEHDQGDEVVEVPVAVADLDGGLDPVVHGLEPCVGQSAADGPEDVEASPVDLLAERDESRDARQERVRGPLAQQGRGRLCRLFEDHPEAFLEPVRLPEGLVGVRHAFQLGLLAGGQVRFVLEQRPPGSFDRVLHALPGRARLPGLAPCGGADLVERVGRPADDVEPVEDAFGLRAPAERALVDPSGPVAGDDPDGFALGGRGLLEEQVEDLLPVALVHPDDASPVVVDDGRHVLVPALVAGLVHADGTQMVEQARALFGAQLVGDASADRTDALPIDAHQRRYRAAGRVHAQPCRLPFEVIRVRALAPRPRHHRDRHPMGPAVDARRRVFQQEFRAADVEMPPTPRGQTVVRPAMPAAFGATVRVPRVRARRYDDHVAATAILLDARRAGHDVRGQVQHALERAG